MLLLATETGVIALYHQATATVQRSLARPKRGMPRSQEDRPRRMMMRPRPESGYAAEQGQEGEAPARTPFGLRQPAEHGAAGGPPAAPPVVIKKRRSRLLVKPDEE